MRRCARHATCSTTSRTEVEFMTNTGDRSPATSIPPPRVLDRAVATAQPEKRLLLAVLEGAVSDFQKYATASSGRGKRLFADADAWFSSSSATQPCDFESICQALALDPSFIRAGLHRWCSARRREPGQSRTVLHFAFRRASGTRTRSLRLPDRWHDRPARDIAMRRARRRPGRDRGEAGSRADSAGT